MTTADPDEEALLDRARSGDVAAYDKLVRAYYGSVCAQAAEYSSGSLGEDDLIQEGLIGLYTAVRDFRAGGSIEFGSFARLRIANELASAVISGPWSQRR